MTNETRHRLVRRLIADDVWALTFQTTGQYRMALLEYLRDVAAPLAAPPPDAGLVALVREWQKRYDEFMTKKHRLSGQRLDEAEAALFAFPLPERTETPSPSPRLPDLIGVNRGKRTISSGRAGVCPECGAAILAAAPPEAPQP